MDYFSFSVLRMSEKAISDMMAAVHRRDTDVEERVGEDQSLEEGNQITAA